jgi:hypothetical protein
MNDLRFALRRLRKSPAFTLVAVLTLALGIGLNTTIFSLINDLFLRGLPFREPSRIVHLDNGDKARDLVDVGISAPRYQLYRDGQTIFDGFAAENFFAFTLTGLGDPVQIFGGRLTSNYFDVLGIRPILGRNFLPEEEESADVALVAKNFWQKRMGGDPNVIGRSIALDGMPHTIAYTVEQRTGEIGVRMALGAQTRDVLRLVVNQGMKPVLVGLWIRIGSAFALGRLIASQLYQVSAHNPALLIGSTLLLAAIALIACLLPARRATQVDPIQALRTE